MKRRHRKRMLGGSSALPDTMRHHYTEGERAALCVVAGEVKRQGVCDLSIDDIADRAVWAGPRSRMPCTRDDDLATCKSSNARNAAPKISPTLSGSPQPNGARGSDERHLQHGR